jgi:hypothetical protein
VVVVVVVASALGALRMVVTCSYMPTVRLAWWSRAVSRFR